MDKFTGNSLINRLMVICLITLWSYPAYAGDTDPVSPPGATMKTLTDIQNRISSGTPAGAHSLQPLSAPGSTGVTLDEIYDALPDGSTTTATEGDIKSGRTFIKRAGGVMTFTTGTMQPHELPDTGQTGSYATGDDAVYNPSATQPSYTDNGDGTITDNRTGLMWVKDGNSAGCNNGSTLIWSDALTFCENLSYAGYTDWRLPNIKELSSIVNSGGYTPMINTTYFSNTKSNYYWTSTTYAGNTSNAWGVSFVSGSVTSIGKITGYCVCPVRGGP